MSELNVEDVLHPKLEWVEGACYRVNRKGSDYGYKNKPTVSKTYEDDDDARCYDDDVDIEVTEDGRLKTTIRVPPAFYSQIIGTKGSRQKQIEAETKAKITIPKEKSNSNIVITGQFERHVVAAKRRLEMIAFDLRNRHEITHFVSFPLISDEIKANFTKFKDLVCSGDPIEGIDLSIFQKVDKIHLTIGTLVLLDDTEKKEASDVLENCKKDIIDPQLKGHGPLVIKMKGIAVMNDDPSHVDVLYAKVNVENHKNPNILQKISDDIVQYFYDKGLIKLERDNVKLHATLINTRYRKESDSDGSGSRSRDRKRRKRIAFDARPILEKYSDFDFGSQQFDSIHLSFRFAVGENGYYETVHAISCI